MMWLLGLIDPISRVINGLTEARKAEANAKTDQERIHAQERIKALEAKRDVLVAEANDVSNRRMRMFIAFGPALYLNKIFVWDKVLGPITHGRTDPLDENLWWVISAVIGFYFLAEASRFIARRR
jgi:hypothetical protein